MIVLVVHSEEGGDGRGEGGGREGTIIKHT